MRRTRRLIAIILFAVIALWVVSLAVMFWTYLLSHGNADFLTRYFLPSTFVAVPLLLTLAMTDIVLRNRLTTRAKALDARLCPHCLYNLSGSPADGVCPECGKPYTHDQLRRYWLVERPVSSG